METYFVVLQLPGSKELRFVDGKYSPENFWHYAANVINQEKPAIVSVRQDTGVSEELRSHADCSRKFETYILFYLMLNKDEVNDKKAIFRKISDLMKVANYEMVIDANDNYQLVMRDYLDMDNIDGHYYGGTHLSA